jgi:acetylornithine deacetylase/succinyl-diaminopimelate desuccinylase-like protein
MSEEMKKYLIELVKLQSVSSDPSKKSESLKTADFVVSKLKEIGAETKIISNAMTNKNPLIYAKLGSDPEKKTILFYSHYDVQPALKEDGWNTDPFTVIEKDGYLYGRGTSDDKGPIVVVYQTIKELQLKETLPVNVCWLYEGEEESGSGGFIETVSKDHSFFGKVDGIMVMDTAWFGEKTPSMDYGFRGLVYAFIEIFGPSADQHSGAFGGSFREPMTDLIYILSKLISLDGKILVEGVYDSVKPLTPEEEELYNKIEFNVNEYKKSIGYNTKWDNEDPKKILMNLWRNPSLSIHGIEGAFYGPGAKTVIPAKVLGKVSIRLVPDQKPTEIAKLFENYVNKEFKKLNSPNTLVFHPHGLGDWWYGDLNNFLFKANQKAIKEYWKMDPIFARSGGSIPIIPFMEKTFNAPAIGMSTGQSTDGAHSQNEKLRIRNLEGSKEVVKLMLKEIARS